MNQREISQVRRALPNNYTALFIGRGEDGNLYIQGTSKWENEYAEDERRAHLQAMGIMQLLRTNAAGVEKIGYVRSRADTLRSLLEKMPEEDTNNVVEINSANIDKMERELLTDGS